MKTDSQISAKYYVELNKQLGSQTKRDIAWIQKNKSKFSFCPDLKYLINRINPHFVFKCESAFSVYFLNSISKLLKAHELIQDTLINQEGEELTDFWIQSDLADYFLNLQNQGLDILQSGLETLHLFTLRTIAFYFLHIEKSDIRFESPLPYPFLQNIGDSKIGLYALENQFFKVHVENRFDIELIEICSSKNQLVLRIAQEEVLVQGISNQDIIFSENRLLVLRFIDETIKNKAEYIARTSLALTLLRQLDSNLLDVLFAGTKYVIPMHEQNIVSYSMQELPLFSSINYDFRNFIDHIDDLLHENGHHLLNLKLNMYELVLEDLDSSYYSPWRKTLRPARGIYHAFITFFWAHHLFRKLFIFTLNMSAEGSVIEELEYISRRYIEENVLLKYCLPVLDLCIEDNKISIDGEKYLNKYRDVFIQDSDLVHFARLTLEVLESKEILEIEKMENRFFDDLEHYHQINHL